MLKKLLPFCGSFNTLEYSVGQIVGLFVGSNGEFVAHVVGNVLLNGVSYMIKLRNQHSI